MGLYNADRAAQTGADPIGVPMPDRNFPKRLSLNEATSIKGMGRDITRGYLGPLLYPQDEVLAGRGYDYQIYENLLRDDQVKATFQQRRSAVISRNYEVVEGGPKRIDKQAAAFIRDTLARIGWDDICDKMLFGVFYGYAIGECLWAVENGQIQLTGISVRKQRRFRFDWDGFPRLMTYSNSYEGETLPECKFWHYSTGADNDDDPYGQGLAHWLYWPVLFKRNGVKSWLKFLERFGMPTPIGRYNPNEGNSEAKKDQLKHQLADFALGEDAALLMPEGVAIELLEAGRSGTADYASMVDHMDAAISKIVLSQTMTTDSGGAGLGSNQADVHSGVKLDVITSDSDLLNSSANQSWVRWLVDWNFPGAAYPTIGRALEIAEEINARASRDKILAALGYRLNAEKVREVYGDGYYDPIQLSKETGDKPPLATTLGVGGITSLTQFLTGLGQSGIPRKNAIAILTAVYGVGQADADAMVPEDAAPTEESPPPSIEDAAALFGEPEVLDPMLFAVLQILDQSVEVDMLTFAETESNAAMEGAIGRRLLALIRPGVLEFAGGAGKKCSKGLNCGGSCISKTKVCRKGMNPEQLKLHKATLAATLKTKRASGGGGQASPPVTPQAAPTDALQQIPKQDPYNPELSVRTPIGRETSYAGVNQDTTNSRIFGARDEAKYFSGYDKDTQVGWLNDHIAHMQVLGGPKAYTDRAKYDFDQIWSKASPEAKSEIADRNRDSSSPIVQALINRDVAIRSNANPERPAVNARSENAVKPVPVAAPSLSTPAPSASNSTSQIQKDVDARIKSGDLPKPYRGSIDKLEFDDDIKVDTEKNVYSANIAGNGPLFSTNKTLSIGFEIEGSYARGEIKDDREGLKVALAVRTAFRSKFKNLPDGLILKNHPYSADGSGSAREKIYALAGFGPLGKDGLMHGVIKNGKLIPLTSEESETYRQSQAKPPRKSRGT